MNSSYSIVSYQSGAKLKLYSLKGNSEAEVSIDVFLSSTEPNVRDCIAFRIHQLINEYGFDASFFVETSHPNVFCISGFGIATYFYGFGECIIFLGEEKKFSKIAIEVISWIDRLKEMSILGSILK